MKLLYNYFLFVFLLNLRLNFINCLDFKIEKPLECIFFIKRSEREYPKKYIDNAINIFKQRKGKTIVEIGSLRFPCDHNLDDESCLYCMDGHSTLLWARTGAIVCSVDIDPEVINNTKNLCQNLKNVNVILQDGIEFLKSFNSLIDLLYLDAWNVVEGTDYAQKHLEAYDAAKNKLHKNSLILIDDTDIEQGGKGKLIIPQAIKDGFKIIFSGRQTLLAKF